MDSTKDKFPSVYDYILQEETDFKTRRIPIASNWNWSMYKHVDMSFQLKNSQFTKGENTVDKFTRPYKNIIIPIANVNYRSEGFDVKDNEIYVDNKDYYHLSLIARKFHDRWAIKYSIDTAIDETVESYFDYGLTLVKNVNEQRPEVVPLQMLAFCDQTDILSGPLCLKHQYSTSQLFEMKNKWYGKEIDRAIANSQFSHLSTNDQEVKTPGKYIEVYELHGSFPKSWLTDNDADIGVYTNQIHIITYYTDAQAKKNGICLFKGPEPKPIFKALKRDPIFGRACGRGGIEELFHSQIWTNYSEIHIQQMLEAASKVVLQTADKKFVAKNKINGFKHNQILEYEEGKPLSQVVIQPFNKTAFDNYVNAWEQNARTIGSASDPQLGLNPVSGTPLGTTQIVTDQGEGIHDYRRGKIAVFWGELYRDWILQYLVDEMNNGDEWLDELSIDELKEVADMVAVNESNKRVIDLVLSGKVVTQEQQDLLTQMIRNEFSKGGKKRFFKILKGEFKKLPLVAKFSVKGKQKNLAEATQKLNGIFGTIFKNPAILQQPGMEDLFNNIIESSGFSPISFSSLTEPPQPPPATGAPPTSQMLPPPGMTPQMTPMTPTLSPLQPQQVNK